jgi:hypothetical protein
MKFSSIALQSIWTHVDLDEYMCIQTRPPMQIEWSSYRIKLRWVSTSSPYHIVEYCRHLPVVLHAWAHSDHVDICMNFLSNHVHSLSILYQWHPFITWFSCRHGLPSFYDFYSLFNNYLATSTKCLGGSTINVYRNYGSFCIGSPYILITKLLIPQDL